jgi:histidinol-phosphate aminotransferase
MTLPKPRATIAALPAYVPGARPSGAGTPPVKLSSNEVAFAPLPSVRGAIAAAGEFANRYPDMMATEVAEGIAARWSVNTEALGAQSVGAESVVVAGGSVAVLGHALHAYCDPGDEVVYAWRSFEAYPILAQIAGAASVRVALAPDARHDFAAMASALTARTKIVLLCTPNNPTGPAIRRDEFEAFMAAVPTSVLVVLDEAYAEFVRDPAAVDGRAALVAHPNLLVMRTFSKAYGLAGLRVGYAVGTPDLVAPVRACVTPFSVSGVAQAAALASLAAEEELLTRVDAVVAERERVVTILVADGWNPPEAQGNFVWLAARDDAAALGGYLAGRSPSILARPFSGDGVRITVGSPQENDHVLAALAAYPDRF